MEVCGGQVTSTDSGGARGAEALSAVREEMVGTEFGNRRKSCSGRLATWFRSAAGRALGAFGDRLSVPVQTPQLLGASRIGDPPPILVEADLPTSTPGGA